MSSSETKKIVNPANIITFVRLLIGLGLLYFLYVDNQAVSIALYLLFLALDFLDGFIARKLNCETLFGKNFDFLTDGIIGFLAALILISKGIISISYVLWISGAIVLLALAIIWGIYIKKNTFIPSKWRKLNAVVFYVILLVFMINNEYSLTIAYLLLLYVYISRIKNLVEIININKKIIPK